MPEHAEIETLLGKPISAVEQILEARLKKNLNPFENTEIMSYSHMFDRDIKLYNFGYRLIGFRVNTDNSVNAIRIYFKEVLDNEFFEAFNSFYGLPYSLLVVDKAHVISETVDSNHHLKKVEYDLREGNFDEGAVLI